MTGRNIVVIGGSAGAHEALRAIVARLPADLAVSVFVVIHTTPDAPGVLDRIVSRAGLLPARYALDGEPIEAGRIYLAPPDRHLLVKPGIMRVTRGPRENRVRPAVDPLFRTAAAAYGSRVIGIVLSGGQDDGAVGIGKIKRAGGIAIVQDPDEALVSSMPLAATRHVDVDHVLPAEDIAGVLSGLVRDRIEITETLMNKKDVPRDVAEGGSHVIHHANDLGPSSPFTCPDCGGTLWQSHDGELLQFHCHVGHRFSGDTLAGGQTEALESALWAALRAFEESAELRSRMARHAHERGMTAIAASYDEQARESEQRATSIRRALMPDARDAQAFGEPATASPS